MLDLLTPSRGMYELGLGLMMVGAIVLPLVMWWLERR
jgi:hypothetical protein